MQLTPECKATIDSMSYQDLLSQWRFSPIGDPMFQEESGEYFAERMKQLRAEPGGDVGHTAASKAIGWESA